MARETRRASQTKPPQPVAATIAWSQPIGCSNIRTKTD